MPATSPGNSPGVAHLEGIAFAIGAKRIAPLWRLLSGIGEDDWTDAIDMDDAQVAVADYRPAWWPSATGCFFWKTLSKRTRIVGSSMAFGVRYGVVG